VRPRTRRPAQCRRAISRLGGGVITRARAVLSRIAMADLGWTSCREPPPRPAPARDLDAIHLCDRDLARP
jgi:hypothetical protein